MAFYTEIFRPGKRIMEVDGILLHFLDKKFVRVAVKGTLLCLKGR